MNISTATLSFPSTFSSAHAGIQRGLSRVATAAQSIAEGDIDPQNSVDLIEGQRMMEMNIKVLQTADEMLGTLLNAKA